MRNLMVVGTHAAMLVLRYVIDFRTMIHFPCINLDSMVMTTHTGLQ